MSKPINPAESFLIRYNFVVLVVISAATLSVAIYLASMTFLASSDPSNAEIKSTVPSTFDKTTREKINTLHESNDQNISTQTPEGRIDPFSE